MHIKSLPTAADTDDQLLRRKEAASLLKVSLSTLDRWRVLGIGPIYSKLVGSVLYHRADLAAFIEGGKRISTGEAV